MLRYRGKKLALNIVKELDSFPKVQEEIYEPSTYSNVILTVLISIFGLWLLISEVQYVLQEHYIYRFVPDTDYESKLPINIDITVASTCDSIGADIVDTTGQNMMLFGELKTDDTWWEMTKEQKQHFEKMREFNAYLREEYHSMKDILWMFDNYNTLKNKISVRTEKPNTLPDACRIHGSLILNKVIGNFHITPGKSLIVPGGHVHLTGPFFGSGATNFSHRINQFSFGVPTKGIMYPLEGELYETNENAVSYKYFIDVVATDVKSHSNEIKTYQYSAKDIQRKIDHNSGSHGMPGIYFQYDINALKFIITENRITMFHLIIEIASTIGGLFLLFNFMKIILDKFTKKVYSFFTTDNIVTREKSLDYK
ncbi:endoplasmic reticulum-Golgi intermediate compartment protein 2 [Myzus persicae]|uniref:endoplasmic reticulum-Golgi intermediate compartment protein 2 n=1 Tax=Myzus persicae TaxID=13164 RepID=UPI000B93962D|nr:endoplasmic reticulum-Golgi intermediate compartment protein 2 [Myzus persicae]XP_022170356.1 endoplasmic reticulum-Golgi intermediate compartment protein 2 [Myzus persicae]XP_022170357.1 endoplasmic reticulum-Golgi intermediate compartment protein 2 [Myzus persicae]XP_022170358.1 endoplasmic reticulum-Golgi intermediate compartment protein 2 [Myzus persicae]